MLRTASAKQTREALCALRNADSIEAGFSRVNDSRLTANQTETTLTLPRVGSIHAITDPELLTQAQCAVWRRLEQLVR